MFYDLIYSLPALIIAAVSQCWLFTAIAIRVAPRLGIVDQPDNRRKVHRVPTPLMGGVAIFLSFALCALEGWYAGCSWLTADRNTTHISLTLFISAGLYCALGLYDDRYHLRPLHKFLGQIVAAIPFAVWGHSIDVVSVLGWNIDLGMFGIPLTIFWLVACTNLVNLMDGLDGLAASLSFVVSVTVAFLAMQQDLPGIAGLNLILAGVLFGFLLHNWAPAKIFMGDSGSLTLGFLVGAFAIESSFKTATGLTLVPPIVLLSIPMFDTTMAIVRRKLNGRGIGEADRQHFHHCLRDRGLSTRQSVLAIAGLCATMGGAVILAKIMNFEVLSLGICGAVLSLLILGRVFGFYETSLLFENMATVAGLVRSGTRLIQQSITLTRLRLGVAQHPESSWDLLLQQVRELQGHTLILSCHESDSVNEPTQLNWNSDQPVAEGIDWELTCRMPRERSHVVQIVAKGRHAETGEHLQLSSLYHLLQLFCQNWPIEPKGDGTIPFAIPAPHFTLPPVHAPEEDVVSSRQRVA
ncbi:MAG: MraY family glycosyltransferase [Planctomycetales bacterium]